MIGESAESTRPLRLRYAGECRACGASLPAGSAAMYESASKTVLCLDCGDGSTARNDDTRGLAGRSARREYEKRSQARETRIRTAHPKIGGLLLALSDEPQRIKAWDTGAKGEERLGRQLDLLQGARVLHDRRIPGSKANIDHIAISSSGIYVIDAKKYTGAPTKRTEGGLFRPVVEHLLVGGRDRTKLVDGSEWQVQQVVHALAHTADAQVRVRGMLAFIDAEWPLLGGDFRIRETDVVWPRKASQVVATPGPLTEYDVDRIHNTLARVFPAA